MFNNLHFHRLQHRLKKLRKVCLSSFKQKDQKKIYDTSSPLESTDK